MFIESIVTHIKSGPSMEEIQAKEELDKLNEILVQFDRRAIRDSMHTESVCRMVFSLDELRQNIQKLGIFTVKDTVASLCSAHPAQITRCKFLQLLRYLCQFMYLTTVTLVLRNSFDLNYLRKMCGTWVARVLLREIQEEVEAIEDLVSIMVPYIPSADPEWTQTFIASGILGGLDYSMSGSILGDY